MNPNSLQFSSFERIFSIYFIIIHFSLQVILKMFLDRKGSQLPYGVSPFGWVSRFSDCLLFSGVSLVFAPDGSGGKDEEVCGRFSGAVRKSNGKRERILLSAVIVRYNSENGAFASVQSPFSEGGAVVRSARASIFSSSALYLPFISSQRAIRLSQTSFSICFPM